MSKEADRPEALDENQQRRLLANFQYADKLLAEIEGILTESQSGSAFPRYRLDVTPAQARVVAGYIARLRAQMLRALRGLCVTLPEPQLGALHSIRVALGFVDIALEQCRPKRMKGYGALPQGRRAELDGMVDELQGLVAQLDAYLAQGSAHELRARLERLEGAGADVARVRILERIVNRWNLVEFRPALAAILDGLETRTFEIAVFGRVSSGKSSLLNHVLETDVLPVGVTPITAVPTRIIYGPAPRGRAWFAGGGTEEFAPGRLCEFVSEEHNPGNRKQVARLIVEMPSSRLRKGVVFVDTPGLGAAEAAGAAETRAYLPRCDLAVVLVNAGSTLTPDDLALVHVLHENATPVHILLSKADLLGESDRERMQAYIAAQMRAELGLDLAVHPVSVRPPHSRLLDAWFDREILPLCDRAHELHERSLVRKTVRLAESVRAALRVRLDHAARTGQGSGDLEQAEKALRVLSGRFSQVRTECFRFTDALRGLAPEVLDRSASVLVENPERDARDVLVQLLGLVASERARLVAGLLEELARDAVRVLRDAGATLDVACHIPTEAELLGPLRELPRLDAGGIPPVPRPGRWTRLAGGALARRITGRRLRRAAAPQVASALASYGRLLEAWVRGRLAELELRFDSCAGIFRAQFDRLESPAVAAGSADQAELLRDLAALDAEPGQASADGG